MRFHFELNIFKLIGDKLDDWIFRRPRAKLCWKKKFAWFPVKLNAFNYVNKVEYAWFEWYEVKSTVDHQGNNIKVRKPA